MTVPAASGYDLSDLKRRLGKDIDDDSEDEPLGLVLSAAEAMVQDWSTEVLLDERTEVVRVLAGRALLSAYPVTSVVAVGTVNPSDYTVIDQPDLRRYPLTDAAAGMLGAPWANGTLLSVTYTAGVTAPSDQFKLAVLEAAAHLWRARQGGSETYLPAGEPDVAGPPLLGGLKKRVLLILGDKAKGPTVA